MDDAFLMRCRQASRRLLRVIPGFPRRERPGAHSFAESLALQHLRHDVHRPIVLAKIMNSQNVGMVERRRGLRLLAESRYAVGIARELGRQDFDRDLAVKP